MNGRMEHKILNEKRIEEKLKNNDNYLFSFYNYLCSKYEYKTREVYISYVDNFLKIINKKPLEIIEDDIIYYLNKISYKTKDGKMIETSGTYRATVHSALKQYFNYLVYTNKIKRNPVDNVPRPKNKKSNQINRTYLDTKEMQKVVNNVKENYNKRDQLIIMTFLYTGIRCTALTEINIEDVDCKNKVLKVIDKRDKYREFEIDEDYISLFNEVTKGKTSGPVFVSNNNCRICQKTVSRVVNKSSSVIEGKHITPHKLRHSYGTNLYRCSKDIYAVKNALGHENISTTQLYIHEDNLEASRAGLAAMKSQVKF